MRIASSIIIEPLYTKAEYGSITPTHIDLVLPTKRYRGADYERFIPMQFTGFINNGREWYEGDILENDSDWYTVEWDTDQGCWVASGVGSTHEEISLCELLSSETWVQGNIYETPGLLLKNRESSPETTP